MVLAKFCREREAAFAERRPILDAAMVPVRQMADPQLDAAIRIVAWVTYGNAAAVWRRLCNTSSCLAGLAASGRRNPIDGQPISDAVSAPVKWANTDRNSHVRFGSRLCKNAYVEVFGRSRLAHESDPMPGSLPSVRQRPEC